MYGRLHVVDQEEGLEDPLVEGSLDEFALSAVGEGVAFKFVLIHALKFMWDGSQYDD